MAALLLERRRRRRPRPVLTCRARPTTSIAEREREKREKKKRKLEQAEAEHDHLISRTTTARPYCKLWLAGKCQPGTRRCAKRHGTDDEADEIMCASVTEPPFRCPGIDCIFAHGDEDVLQRKIGPDGLTSANGAASADTTQVEA